MKAFLTIHSLRNILPLFASLFLLATCQSSKNVNESQSTTTTIPLRKTAINCTYALSYRIDSIARYNQTELMSLQIAGDSSQFESRRKIVTDSLDAFFDTLPNTDENAQLMVDQMMKTPQPNFSYCIYKNHKSGDVTYFDAIANNLYSYSEPADVLVWRTSPERDTILGYDCQKATTTFRGRNFSAWFTRQIPISEGPYKFHGLPGLIVKLSDVRNHYVFELKKLVLADNYIRISGPTKTSIATTRDEFLKGESDYNNNMVDRAIAMGIKVANPEAARKNVREKMSRRNNPLELK